MRKVRRYKFGSSSKYKGYEFNIYLMIDPIDNMFDYKSWFQVEIEKGSGIWAMILDRKLTIEDGQNKIFDYIDRLAKQAEKVA